MLDPTIVRGDAWQIISPEVASFTRLSHDLDKQIFNMIAEILTPLGISQTQALFIVYMNYYEDRTIYHNVLEKAFGLKNPTVTASVRSLVNKGIVIQERDPDDGRYFRLTLTEKGKGLFVPCIRAFLDTNNALLEKLTVEEEQQFIKLVKKILA